MEEKKDERRLEGRGRRAGYDGFMTSWIPGTRHYTWPGQPGLARGDQDQTRPGRGAQGPQARPGHLAASVWSVHAVSMSMKFYSKLWSFCRPWSRWYNLIWRNNHFAKGFIRNHENSLFSWSFINPLLRIPSLLSSPSPMSSIPKYGPITKSPIRTSDQTKIRWATTRPLTFEIVHF